MSEYQYYEFQAIDRALSEDEMAELRSHSTRARITPTSFVNDYSWGGFKGDVERWMDEYFDAFVYLANWGTRELKLRLPAGLLDEKLAELFCVGDGFWMSEANGRTVLTFLCEDEDDGEWVEPEGWLASLVGLRSELARGDVRALYLGWLHCAYSGFLDDDDVEPPVPPGLGGLTGALESLVGFLRIDPDLVDVAAAASPALSDSEPRSADVRQWLASLTLAEKDQFLTRLVTEDDSTVRFELAKRFRREVGSVRNTSETTTKRRSVADLLGKAQLAAEERHRVQSKKAAQEEALRERQAAIARAQYLDKLDARQPAIWDEVENLIATKQPKRYDRAIELLLDLRDLAERQGDTGMERRIKELRRLHARKPSFIRRLLKAGLAR